ncbi:hypothetical protein [Streptomyces sp. FH025]|uniref:DUF7848 domain-containing protein n=1 Tax=Streptomyces sp. FH025 TaxID=2815937 RepID=UPI001A9F93A5|nr:hypothetical protein [Streptomyces sp. FH025]MBO1415241.1 hypothetical protein [Streptomyces sp. FH025]
MNRSPGADPPLARWTVRADDSPRLAPAAFVMICQGCGFDSRTVRSADETSAWAARHAARNHGDGHREFRLLADVPMVATPAD